MGQVINKKLSNNEIQFNDSKIISKELLSKANYDNMMEIAKTASSALVDSKKQLRKLNNEERLVSARPLPKTTVPSPQFKNMRPSTASTRVSNTRTMSGSSSRATFRPFSRSSQGI